MESTKFPLSHLVLYSKGWYKRTENVWGDLLEILKLDDYTPFRYGDVYAIILDVFSEFDNNGSKLRNVMTAIHPSECWKYGYYVKENHLWSNVSINELPNYDMPTAFIYYVLSVLRYLEKDNWNQVTPKYKLSPKNPNIETKQIIEIFNKKV